MTLRMLALGLFSFLALAGCSTSLVVNGEYNFAKHPGKGLIAFSTRMDAGMTCSSSVVRGDLGFRMSPLSAGGAGPSYASVDARILMREPMPDALFLLMQTPIPERTMPIYSMDSTYSDMGTADVKVIPAEPPTRFAVAEVTAGRYTLNSMVVRIQGNPGFYKPTVLPEYSFTVKEGEVVYLGELGAQLDRTSCDAWESRLAPVFMWTVHDEWARDEARFKEEIHNIPPEAVQKRLLTRSLGD